MKFSSNEDVMALPDLKPAIELESTVLWSDRFAVANEDRG